MARGGVLPTVTDANVVLGYLPENLLGGSFKLDRAAATRAVQTIADALKTILDLYPPTPPPPPPPPTRARWHHRHRQ